MSESLAIERVRFEETSGLTPAMRRSGVRPYRLALTVTNSAATPLQVSATLTQIHYDAELRTLVLGIGAHDQSGQPLDLRFAAQQVTIEPESNETLEFAVYSPISFGAEPFDDLQPRDVHIDTDVDTVECTIEFHVVNAESAEPQRAHATWSNPVRS